MQPVLSFIIPTYNMETLLPRCIDSLVQSAHLDMLEVIIVNDGSKDNSLAVGRQYEEHYPAVVHVVDKPNGNYGSTINAALPLVRGKYVKILDSDDWVDTNALDSLLENLNQTDVDMVVTHLVQWHRGGQKEVVRYNTMGREPYTYGQIYNMDNVLKDKYIRFFLMPTVTYRTDLLHAIEYRQTEGISYTDTEWATIPLFHVQTIIFFNLMLYHYDLNREGQTMSPAVLMRSIPQLEKVTDRLLAYYRDHQARLSPVRQAFMKQYFENRVRILYKLYLLDMPRKDFSKDALMLLDNKLTTVCAELGLRPRLYPENKILRIDYIAFWHKHHRRWHPLLETFNHTLDIVARWFYLRLFRK